MPSLAMKEQPVVPDPRFVTDVLDGLARPFKSVPSLWLYDFRGSELFEEITHLEEYYPTRTEIGLLENHAADIATRIGPGATVVEIGSGSSRKTPLLLSRMQQLRAYVPIDISDEFLHESIEQLRKHLPDLPCHPVAADFTQPRQLRAVTEVLPSEGPCVGFFPGSTIGNFTPEVATRLLRQFADMLGPHSWLIVGVDSTRDEKVLVPAYDDARGVTAEFNLNLLRRINRELEGTFDVEAFHHEARFNAERGRMEMHLVSRAEQHPRVLGRSFRFASGESIHTENSYKYSVQEFAQMAYAGGWRSETRFAGSDDGFGLFLLHQGD
ncbi:MAG: L-histidine N(alpha)-methyltransferase [Betaproteobacteria bacterium]|nr:L-histidine N(alpha)-methyltransferase [Betaproteobacteria bacterium]